MSTLCSAWKPSNGKESNVAWDNTQKCEKCGQQLHFEWVEFAVNTGTHTEVTLKCQNEACDASYSFWIPNDQWAIQNK
jgi:hypothetical protein